MPTVFGILMLAFLVSCAACLFVLANAVDS